MFKEELEEIEKLVQEEINKERTYSQKRFEYATTAEEFLEIKERIKKLDIFSYQLEPVSILNIDFYNSPISLWAIKDQIDNIIDNALADELFADGSDDAASTFSDIIQSSMPKGVSTISSPVGTANDWNETKEDQPITFNITINNPNNSNSGEAIKTIIEGLKRIGVNINQ
jgi:hypothetical protein